MSSNGEIGCPEDMQVESAAENSSKQTEGVSERQIGINHIAKDINGMSCLDIFVYFQYKNT